MRLHFFTVNNIEDYRKNYHLSKEANDLLKTTKALTKQEFDDEFFPYCISRLYRVPERIFESRIYNETGIDGLRLDFNFGLRLDVPEGNFRIKISDFETKEIFFDEQFSNGRLLSVENYFIRWHVEVFLDDEKIFTHTLNLEGKPVGIICRSNGLGDFLAFLPYFREFQKRHRCNLVVFTKECFRDIATQLYPDITQVDNVNFAYAVYFPVTLHLCFPFTPADMRRVPLYRIGGMLFGMNYLPPKAIFKPTAPPVTDEPYVCISVQASYTRKSWLWAGGWDVVVDYLKNLGYRVFCIDKNAQEENDGFTICKPEGAEDFTGDIPLIERANMLYHAEFFIGLSSGLSWIADAVNCPVVMICGFSQDWCEFYTPYRVANRRVCNGCFNDDHVYYCKDRCPYHKNTPREFECQKKISPLMVISAIERLIIDKKLIPPVLRRNLS